MNTNGYFIYNGVDTRSLGVDVARGAAGDLFTRPAREYQVDQAPGRLGDIIQDNRHFPNVEIRYFVMIPDNFDAVYRQLRSVLLGATGYARLEDSWATDEYYMAYVSAPLQPTVSANRRQATVEVVFSRRPERWLKSGETPLAGYNSISWRLLDIATRYPFYPLIRIKSTLTSTDTSAYATALELLRVRPLLSSGTGSVTYSVYLYKPLSRVSGGANVLTKWADYFMNGDVLALDMEAGTLANETQGTDLTPLLQRSAVDGLLPPAEYEAGATGLSIYIADGTWFDAVTLTPRWYNV